jgi:hypothetical protein
MTAIVILTAAVLTATIMVITVDTSLIASAIVGRVLGASNLPCNPMTCWCCIEVRAVPCLSSAIIISITLLLQQPPACLGQPLLASQSDSLPAVAEPFTIKDR